MPSHALIQETRRLLRRPAPQAMGLRRPPLPSQVQPILRHSIRRVRHKAFPRGWGERGGGQHSRSQPSPRVLSLNGILKAPKGGPSPRQPVCPPSDLLGGSEAGPPPPPPGFAKEGPGPEAAAVSLVPKGPFLSVLPHPPSRGEFHDSRNSLLSWVFF